MNVVSQFYCDHTIWFYFHLLLETPISGTKKYIYYFQLKLKNWISHLSQQATPSKQWAGVYVGVKTTAEYKHELK